MNVSRPAGLVLSRIASSFAYPSAIAVAGSKTAKMSAADASPSQRRGLLHTARGCVSVLLRSDGTFRKGLPRNSTLPNRVKCCESVDMRLPAPALHNDPSAGYRYPPVLAPDEYERSGAWRGARFRLARRERACASPRLACLQSSKSGPPLATLPQMLKVLTSASNPVEQSLLIARLSDAGIPCMRAAGGARVALGSGRDILVEEEDLARAHEILQEDDEGFDEEELARLSE